MPIRSLFFDPVDAVSEAAEASPNNCPPKTAVSGRCCGAADVTSASKDSSELIGTETSAAVSGADGGSVTAVSACCSGASHEGTFTSSSAPSVVVGGLRCGETGLDSTGVTAFGSSAIASNSLFDISATGAGAFGATGTGGAAGFSVKSMELSCACNRAASCRSCSVEGSEDTGAGCDSGAAGAGGA